MCVIPPVINTLPLSNADSCVFVAEFLLGDKGSKVTLEFLSGKTKKVSLRYTGIALQRYCKVDREIVKCECRYRVALLTISQAKLSNKELGV